MGDRIHRHCSHSESDFFYRTTSMLNEQISLWISKPRAIQSRRKDRWEIWQVRGIFPGSSKLMDYVVPILATHHQEVGGICWSDERSPGRRMEWAGIVCPHEEREKKWNERDCTRVLWESDWFAGFNDRVWRYWEEDIDPGRGMYPELFNRGVYKIKLSQQNSDNGPDDTQELLCALICFRVEYFHQ